MAHPGIWGLAGLSAAFIAAGVWLNRPDRAEFPFRAGAPEPGQVSPEVELRPETPAEATTDPVGQPVEAGPIVELAPEPIAEPGSQPSPEPSPVVDLPPKDELPPPAPVDAEPAMPEPPAPPAEQALSPDLAPTPEPASGPGHEPAPEAAPLAEATETDAVAGTDRPAQAATEDSTDGPLIFTGADIWLLATPEDVAPEAIAEATRSVDAHHGGPLAYGAVAAPRARPDVLFVLQGYNELGRAEAHALALCERFESDCVILAWRVPEDWDGAYAGTLGARQRAAWAEFQARPAASYRAFAISAEGATGQAAAETSDNAVAIAVVECLRDQDRIRQPGVIAGRCELVALRPARPEPGPDTGPAVGPDAGNGTASGSAASVEEPRTFTGGDVWQRENMTFFSHGAGMAQAGPDPSGYFTAVVLPQGAWHEVYIARDYGELGLARDHAMALCVAAGRTDCVLVATQVPEDWDRSLEGTIGARQYRQWRRLDYGVFSGHRAFAGSAEGAHGVGTAETPEAAAQEALALCREMQSERAQAGLVFGDCRIMGQRYRPE